MNRKKRILVVSHALELGGAERSLLGLLDAIDPERVTVDLFLLRHEGELFSFVPEYINVLPEIPAYTVLARPMKDTLKEGHVLLTAARLVGKLAAHRYDKVHEYNKDSGTALEYSHKYTCFFMPLIQPDTEYDLAISFLTPHYFVARKVKARKKIAWIHTDYSRIQIDQESEYAMWDAYDSVISISDAVTESFLKTFPGLKNKIILVENILSVNVLLKQAEDENVLSEMSDLGIKLLSIGRYCTAKNFDNIPDICVRLVEKGLDVYWYIIGYGPDEQLIQSQIEKFQMEDRVILLGKKDNPYVYINACDLYVQPSRYEGNSVTVREAQSLGKPVVITKYATSSSQLTDGVDGIIVPMDNQGCADGIDSLLRRPEVMKCLSENCRNNDYSNRQEIDKLYRLMDEL